MKVLAIGDSHSAHFKIAVENAATFSDSSSLGFRLDDCEFRFSAVPGENFRQVLASGKSSKIKVPNKFFRYKGKLRQSNIPYFETSFTEFDCNDFDLIVWVQGPNVIREYHMFWGVSVLRQR